MLVFRVISFLHFYQHTYMVTDHKQQYRDVEDLSSVLPVGVTPARMWEIEKERRAGLRKILFPHVSRYFHILSAKAA